MFSASSVRRGEWCDRPCTVQCRVQAAARRRSTPPRRPCVHRAVRYISEESRSANRTGSLRPFSFWKGGRPDLGRILRISFFVHSVFYGRTVFLSLFRFCCFYNVAVSGRRCSALWEWAPRSPRDVFLHYIRVWFRFFGHAQRSARPSSSYAQRRFTYGDCNLSSTRSR